jgi:hypothetical protein
MVIWNQKEFRNRNHSFRKIERKHNELKEIDEKKKQHL